MPRRTPGTAVADAETMGVLLAARELAALGLLAAESDPLHMDVCVHGQGFRYLVQFWTHTGVLEASDSGWYMRFDGNEGAARARIRVANEWARAGAPVEWARAEADSALEALLRHTVGIAWGTA